LNITPSHLISKSISPFSLTINAQHPHDECPAIVSGFSSNSVILTFVNIENVSILATFSFPGNSEVSRVFSSPLNLYPGSAIHKNTGIGSAASSLKDTRDF